MKDAVSVPTPHQTTGNTTLVLQASSKLPPPPHLHQNLEWSSDSKYLLCAMYKIQTVRVRVADPFGASVA